MIIRSQFTATSQNLSLPDSVTLDPSTTRILPPFVDICRHPQKELGIFKYPERIQTRLAEHHHLTSRSITTSPRGHYPKWGSLTRGNRPILMELMKLWRTKWLASASERIESHRPRACSPLAMEVDSTPTGRWVGRLPCPSSSRQSSSTNPTLDWPSIGFEHPLPSSPHPTHATTDSSSWLAIEASRLIRLPLVSIFFNLNLRRCLGSIDHRHHSSTTFEICPKFLTIPGNFRL
jgi:hypothetical protein